MSKTRFSRLDFSAKSMLTTMSIATSSASYAAESIDQLAARIGMNHFREAIKKDDRGAFKTLPAKGYKNGFTGLLIKASIYVNPEYNFADCDTDIVIISVQEHKTLLGRHMSLKLATKDSDSSCHDNGIHAEYSIATDSKKFTANSSTWAQYTISGGKVLKPSLK